MADDKTSQKRDRTDTRKAKAMGKEGRANKRGRPWALKAANLAGLRAVAQSLQVEGLSRFLAMPVPAVLTGGFGASIVSTILATKLADSILSQQTRTFDHKMLNVARGERHSDKRLLDPVMSLLSAAGEPWTLYPLAALLATMWVAEERSEDAATLVLGLVGGAGINEVIKRVVHRPRPIWKLPFPRSKSSGSSFPSNHATMSLATYGTIAFLLARKRKADRNDTKGKHQEEQTAAQLTTGRRVAARVWAPVLLLCGLIGWSRVYQGVHNPSDVLGGWLAGGIWLLTCSTAANRSQGKQGVKAR